jgi:hypothetical protein
MATRVWQALSFTENRRVQYLVIQTANQWDLHSQSISLGNDDLEMHAQSSSNMVVHHLSD